MFQEFLSFIYSDSLWKIEQGRSKKTGKKGLMWEKEARWKVPRVKAGKIGLVGYDQKKCTF